MVQDVKRAAPVTYSPLRRASCGRTLEGHPGEPCFSTRGRPSGASIISAPRRGRRLSPGASKATICNCADGLDDPAIMPVFLDRRRNSNAFYHAALGGVSKGFVSCGFRPSFHPPRRRYVQRHPGVEVRRWARRAVAIDSVDET